MDEMLPRPQAPQPKVFTMQPPSYTVPDVSVIVESGDSLVMKSHQNWQESINEPNNKRLLKHKYHAPDVLCKENIPSNDNIQSKFEKIRMPLSFASASKVSKLDYNPDIYMSPTTSKASTRNHTPKTPLSTGVRPKNSDEIFVGRPCVNNSPDIKFDCRNKTIESQTKYPILVNKEFPVVRAGTGNSCKYEIPENEVMKHTGNFETNQSSQQSPLTGNLSGSLGPNLDPHMLKLFEYQNMEIRYLHKLLEKFTGKSSNIQSQDCSDGHCTCYENRDKTPKNKRTAEISSRQGITNKKSVATNTEISWGNLHSDYELNLRKTNNYPTSNRNFENKREIKLPVVSQKTNGRPKIWNPSCTSVAKEVTKALEGIHMNTIYNHVSPETSLHIDAPEFSVDQSSTDEEGDQRYACNIIDAERADDLQDGKSPQVAFYERRQPREFLKNEYATNPRQKKKGEKLMKAIKNLGEFIDRGGGEEAEVDYVPTKDNEERRKEFRTPPEVQGPGMRRIQMEHFGVSVVDCVDHHDASQGASVINAFIMGRYLQGEIIPPVGGTLNSPHRARLGSYPQAHAAAINKRSPGKRMDRRVRIQSDKCSPPPSAAKVEEFSIATEQYFCKYKLDG